MRLRQIAVATSDLVARRAEFMTLVGARADFEDPGVGEFGLTNSVIALGNTFFEIVSPVATETAAGRMLTRQGGDCGYMVLMQTDDLAPVSRRMIDLNLRKIWETERAEVSAFHIHPKDIGGAIVSIDEMRPPASWLWGGPNWENQRADWVGDILSATLSVEDPRSMSHHWAKVLSLPCNVTAHGFELALQADQTVLFVEADRRPVPGLCGLSLAWIGPPEAKPPSTRFCGITLEFR